MLMFTRTRVQTLFRIFCDRCWCLEYPDVNSFMLIVFLFILKISCFFLVICHLFFVHSVSPHSYWENCVFVNILSCISQSSNNQFHFKRSGLYINVQDQLWYRRPRSHNDDTDTVICINTDKLNYIIGNDKSQCLHLQICFLIWTYRSFLLCHNEYCTCFSFEGCIFVLMLSRFLHCIRYTCSSDLLPQN